MQLVPHQHPQIFTCPFSETVCCKWLNHQLMRICGPHCRFRGHLFTFHFILATVQRPIIGANFFRKNHQLADVAWHRLLLLSLSSSISCHCSSFSSSHISLVSSKSPFLQLLHDYLQITRPIFDSSFSPLPTVYFIGFEPE